jgi:DNA-binding response OmpR family regulator
MNGLPFITLGFIMKLKNEDAPMPHKILIADDEQPILDTLSAYFKADGYEVVTAQNGRDALFTFRHERPDVVILDVMMPEMTGWEVARAIRRESSVPLMFLTARVDDIDQITGLEIGADDYIAKPFSPRVVVARVQAILRRTGNEFSTEKTLYRVGALKLDSETHIVTRMETRIDLTPSEFSLLQTLIARPGRVFTRMELLDHLQGEAYAGYERTIDVHVKNLRVKIEDDPHDPRYIETVYGVGYRMMPEHEK